MEFPLCVAQLKRTGPKLLIVVSLCSVFIWFQSTRQYSSGGTKLKTASAPLAFSENHNIHPIVQKDISSNSTAANFFQLLASIDRKKESPTSLIELFVPYLIKEPVEPIDESCNPEPLPHVSDNLCVGDFNKNAFTGKLREKPVKTIVHSVKFSFEVDVLEIHLNELYDVVDYFFIVESVNAHADSSPKPLLWEFVKNQPRFKKFEKKIVRFILDDSSVTLPSPDFGIWIPERREEVIRWEKIKQWLDHYELSSDALIGFGDGDEITSRHLVHRMRYCELKKEVFDIGMLFSFGNLEKAYNAGYLSLNYGFSGATFWTYDAATKPSQFHSIQKLKTYPTYRRSKNLDAALFGGDHLSDEMYLPFILTKMITKSSGNSLQGDFYPTLDKLNYSPELPVEELNLRLMKAIDSRTHRKFGPRQKKIEKVLAENPESYKPMFQIPWFLTCNLQRYPAWSFKYDLRLSD